MVGEKDLLERFSRYITLTVFAINIVVFFTAPVLALSWRNQPFPGFLTEHTLVVNDRIEESWTGRESGLQAPYQVVRVAGVSVRTSEDIKQALQDHSVGEYISVVAQLPGGKREFFPSIQLMNFPGNDFFQFFWLPYFLGLAYALIGIWIYLLRGASRPGRALSFFCASVALTLGLLFDVLTTHTTTSVWIISIALLGGSLISLALRFPVEWGAVTRKPWLLAIPYLFSAGFSLWGIFSLWNDQNPWMYLTARSISYVYTAVSTLFFFGMMAYRARANKHSVVRRQARFVLSGSVLAFLPMVVWFLAPLANLNIPFNSAVFLPGLLLFPIAVGLAILRYRLLEIDTFVNQAIVYALITAVLAGGFNALDGLSKRLFIAITGEESDAAVVLTTLIIAASINPIKTRVQSWVDQRVGEKPAAEIKTFGDEVRLFVQMNDIGLLTQRFLDESARSLGAESGAVYLYENGQVNIGHTYGPWMGNALVSVPLEKDGTHFGVVMLGPKRNGKKYKQVEVDSLNQVSKEVAQAILVAKG
jgi:hypothetical protein